jgi:hypothetical protein
MNTIKRVERFLQLVDTLDVEGVLGVCSTNAARAAPLSSERVNDKGVS